MKKYVYQFTSGILIGSGFILPGVSGPAIALVLGLYDNLIASLTLLFHNPKKLTKDHIALLFTVTSGMIFAFLLLSRFLNYLIVNASMMTYAFFIGLILGCIPILYKRTDNKNYPQAISFIIGLGIILFLTFSPKTIFNIYPLGHTYSFLDNFFAGMLNAIFLPGLSGSYLMLLFGNYQHLLAALSNFDLKTLAQIGVGILFGIFFFTGMVNWLLKKFHSATYAFLIGMMAGSIAALWPFSLPVNINTFYAVFFVTLGFLCSSMLAKLKGEKAELSKANS